MIKKKVAIFIPTLNPGGTEHCFVKLANALVEKVNSVQLVLSRKEGVLLTMLNSSVELIDLGNRRFSTSFGPLVRYIKREQPDYLITGSNMHNEFVVCANIIARKQTKVIITQRNFLDVELRDIPIYGRLYGVLMRCFYPKAYKVVAVSDGVESMLKALKYDLDIVKIYNPFDIKRIKEFSQEEIIDAPENYIVYVGRLVKVKNLKLLIDAFELLKDEDESLSLCIVGDGVERSNLECYVAERGIGKSVYFLGNKANIYPYVNKAKALVLPSFSESFGGVLVESLALGVPCVATPTQGAQEISDNGKYITLTTDFEEPIDMKNKISSVINTSSSYDYLKERAEKYSVEVSLQGYLNLFRE